MRIRTVLFVERPGANLGSMLFWAKGFFFINEAVMAQNLEQLGSAESDLQRRRAETRSKIRQSVTALTALAGRTQRFHFN